MYRCGEPSKRESGSATAPVFHHRPILDHQLNTLPFGYPSSASKSEDYDNFWTKLFPIGKDCGVNLQAPVFEVGKEDSKRDYQVGLVLQVERENSHLQESGSHRDLKKEESTVGYLSPSLTAIVTKSIGGGDEEEHAMFVIGMCTCETCNRKQVNTLQVEPMEVTMKLGYFKDLARSVLLSFFPGVTSHFQMKDEARLCRPHHFVYYSSFLPLSALNIHPFKGETGTTYVFRDRREGEASRFMSKWTPSVVEITKIRGMKPLCFDEEMKALQADMELVSSEGKGFPCHRSVLSVQSPVFEETLSMIPVQIAGVQTRSRRKLNELPKIELTENSLVTEIFVKCLYNRDVLQLLNMLDFEGVVGVLQLASKYRLMNLLGKVSSLVTKKLGTAGIQDVALLWKINEVVTANSTIQIIDQLREILLDAAQRILQPNENKRVKLSEDLQNLVGALGLSSH